VLQSNHKIFILHKLLAEKGMMTSVSQELHYMDCSQHSRSLFLMVSNGLEDRRHLEYVGAILLSEYELIFNLIVNVNKFNVRNTDPNKSNKICAEVYIVCLNVLVGAECFRRTATLICKSELFLTTHLLNVVSQGHGPPDHLTSHYRSSWWTAYMLMLTMLTDSIQTQYSEK